MPQVLIGQHAEQPAAPFEADRELEIGEIAIPVGAAQPVLFLGEIVVADAGAMQPPQHGLGGAEIGAITLWFGDMQRDALDPAAHQLLVPAEEKRRRDLERFSTGKGAALA